MQHYKQFLASLKDNFRLRTLSASQPLHHNFSHNDYLNLSTNPEVIANAINFAQTYGVGSTSSRLIDGTKGIHLELEKKLAKIKGQDASLTFASGFQANISVLKALLDKRVLGCEPLVFADRLNHSSMHLGCQLAGARQIRYSHLDMNELEHLLIKHKDSSQPKFILTESVFSMDGDYPDMQDLAYISNKYNCFLYLDEAHATGLYGSSGYGLSEGLNIDNCLIMGTFSKAIGSQGGFVASSEVIIDYLVNYASGFIYSTGISPMIVGAVEKSLELIPTLSETRRKIFNLADYLREKLSLPALPSHIIPIIIGSEEKTMLLKEKLAQNGILVGSVRPPTVPVGTSRLRVAINSHSTKEGIDKLVEIILG